ncbi:hypothetical protein B0T20DRAFT_372525 [Sordaria brevicollis]|uniref:Uncharacterized protein n=1 Tax=Sordaria brevicollis TaxID=83679 RepID=A0AAE0PHI0_SORBR|nr:hypothetical protein B0T20DRAFT_372525 [Sordaria brevicollis]
MKFQPTLLLALQVLSVAALPHPKKEAVEAAASSSVVASASTTIASATASTTTSAVASATATAGAGAGAGAGGDKKEEEEEKDENEVEQTARFNAVVTLGGGNVKTDTLFPAGTNGIFEIEFQNPTPRQLRVTENKTPAPPPPGFKAVEPVSYRVEMGGGSSKGLTLSKIDYIRNADSTIDMSQVKLGKLCTETKSFVIGDGIGETEFEEEENEIATKVEDLVGEWAVFVPDGAAAGGAGGAGGVGEEEKVVADPAAGAETGGVAAGCGPGTACRTLVDGLLSLINGAAAQQAGRA